MALKEFHLLNELIQVIKKIKENHRPSFFLLSLEINCIYLFVRAIVYCKKGL